MSESEKAQRAAYQQQRKKILTIILAVAAALLVLTAVMSSIYVALNNETYVFVHEEGSVLYHAYLNDNEYYEEERLNGNHAYVSSLINHMDAAFTYCSEMAAEDVTYRYRYRVDAQLAITDRTSGAAIYNPVENILPSTEGTITGSMLKLDPTVDIDYHKYNQKAKDFIDDYNLGGVSSELRVTMYVDVIGMSETFAQDDEGQYTIQVRIPLNQTTVKPETTSTIPTADRPILANPNEHKTVFKVLAIIFGILDGAAIATLVVVAIKTRDVHLDYARKVQKLVSNYKAFIQQINNPFDETGYQVLSVTTFNEMLEIRDTLQVPLLMFENEDKTCTRFIIPTTNGLLYAFEIKVDTFDQLYAQPSEADASAEEPIGEDTFPASETDAYVESEPLFAAEFPAEESASEETAADEAESAEI